MELLLKPDGLYERRWDKELQPEPDYVEEKISKDRFFSTWQHVVQLEGKPKFKDLVAVLDALGDDQKEVLGQLLYCNVAEFIEESKKPFNPTAKPDEAKLDTLEVSVTVELRRSYVEQKRRSRYMPDEPVFELGTYVVGKSYSSSENWGISLTPVNELNDLELVISDRVEIDVSSLFPIGPLRTKLEGMSFGEFLGALFWEIGFHVSPAQRDADADVLKGRIDDIESGKGATVPMDDILDRLEKVLGDEEEE